MPVKSTNRSRPPSSGVMKPNPLSSENHLTVPVPTDRPHLLRSTGPRRPRRCRTYPPQDAESKGPFGHVNARLAGGLSAGERGRGGGDLLAVAGRRHPRELERVVRVP